MQTGGSQVEEIYGGNDCYLYAVFINSQLTGR